ncbi:MAG: hypothetical protein U9R01_01700 [candidate division WOR-3 bacterium]|nr:hypothetical protein [candidate division WOR-3 bacterium]
MDLKTRYYINPIPPIAGSICDTTSDINELGEMAAKKKEGNKLWKF